MKPRVHQVMWFGVSDGRQCPRWHVEFEDSCGCMEDEDFGTFETALRFAHHIAGGGDRWGFVA